MAKVFFGLGSFCLICPLLSAQFISLDEGPIPGQLYSRDLATNQAIVPVSGTVLIPNFSRIHLVVTQDGFPWSTAVADLDYSNGAPSFSFAPTIEAGFHDYAFELLLDKTGQTQQIGLVNYVACGDAFLINGQSNAVAADYHAEGMANVDQSRWVRSFGSATFSSIDVINDQSWHLAEGLKLYERGSVGAWGLRAARLISDRYQIPIALINGAVGGTLVNQHSRDDSDPENLQTIYGRLLYRARKAGIDQSVRGILWHQGESDAQTLPADYSFLWDKLRNDWLWDYPALEQIFVFQIRTGCGGLNIEIRELQRTSGDFYPDVTVLPTAGIDGHDGCHFRYSGYREMGTWMAGAIAKVLYGESISAEKIPPNILEARFTSSARDEIELAFRLPAQTLILDPNIEDYFTLGSGVPETIVSAVALPGKIILQLSGNTTATEITYRGHKSDGPWIRNSAGVGAFTFKVSILP